MQGGQLYWAFPFNKASLIEQRKHLLKLFDEKRILFRKLLMKQSIHETIICWNNNLMKQLIDEITFDENVWHNNQLMKIVDTIIWWNNNVMKLFDERINLSSKLLIKQPFDEKINYQAINW